MLTRSFALTCLSIAIIAASVGARPASAQAKSACDCPDVYDLINRLNMDEAAISALQVEVRKIEAFDLQSGKTSNMLDTNAAGQTNQNVLRGVINGAMINAQMPGGNTSQGDTGGFCGSSLVQSSTKCMNEIVMFHEDTVHVPACESDRRAGKTTAIGARASLTTVAYVNEEIAGYQAEIKRIREVLNGLPDSCRPTGWVGMIYYFEEKHVDATDTVTTSGTWASSNTQTSNDVFKRETKILYRETDTPTGNVHVEEKITKHESSTNRIACTIRQALTVPDRTTTFAAVEITDVSGMTEHDVGASFNFDPQTGKIGVSFEVPETPATGTINRTETVQGECNPDANGNKTTPAVGFSTTYGKEPIAVEGVAAGNADVIRGSKTLDLTGTMMTAPNLSIVHGARVTWAFFKVN